MTKAPVHKIRTELPEKLGFLLDMHRYKVAYGGRGAAKTWSFGSALLNLGAAQKLRILGCREIQKSIRDSAHALLCDRIEMLGLGSFYDPSETGIVGRNGTEFLYAGLSDHTSQSIKSFEAIDIAWVLEGQTVRKRSWDILIPTIRAPDSEIWVEFNPDMDSDDTYQRFVMRPPPGAMVVKVTYADNPWFPPVLEAERLHMKATAPDDYDNIWEGKPRSIVAGAIYSREVTQMVEDQRIRPMPYDPRFPVHTIWDLGWNDAMSIIMVQKVAPGALAIINYREDSFRTYAEFVAELNALPYVWGRDWLPHDAENKDPKSGSNAKEVLRRLGRKDVKVMEKTGPEARIKAARMMFPRVYIDDTSRSCATGFFGGSRLVDCLKRYRRNVPKTTDEPATPVHDAYSHAADAFGALAEIVDQIRNEGDRKPPPPLPVRRSTVRGAGMLG